MDTRQLGLQVRDARRARKMKQRELADLVGVSSGTIQNLESGKRDTHPDTVMKVRQVLDMAGDEAETRAQWPDDVQVIVDMIGQWLVKQTPERRREYHHEQVELILNRTPTPLSTEADA